MLNKKKNSLIKLVGIGSMCLFLLGCSEESFLISDEPTDRSNWKTEAGQNISSKVEDSSRQEVVDEQAGSGEEKNTGSVEKKEDTKEIAVHICGAVNQPGVYLFKNEARIYEGIQKAGGFQSEAAKDYLNLALPLEDGMKIEVPTEEMVKIMEEKGQGTMTGISYGNEPENASGQVKEDGKIDLNTAEAAVLCTLPGIGESKARSIIAYREEHGGFEKPEDIMNISGIKEAAYEKIKDFVTVSR